MFRILFTGGGTGGHIYPILAVTHELQEMAAQQGAEVQLYYLGVPESYRILLEQNGIKVKKILASKLRRYFDLRNIIDVPKFILSFFSSLWKLFWIMPDVLFSKGGPGAMAVVLACRFYRIPVVIHESDIIPGLTSRFSAKHAKKILTSFGATNQYFQKQEKITLVGNPIRSELLEIDLNQQSSKTILGFDPNKPLLLVMGGSQGAVFINDFMLDIFPEIISQGLQVFHQTGVNNFNAVEKEINFIGKSLTPEQKSRFKITPYLEKNLKEAMTAADIVVSRAGSGSIFEIAAFGKPSILIPLPESAADHQTLNAYEYAKTGAAIVIEQSNLTPNLFFNQIQRLFASPEIIQKMSEAAKNFSKPEAAKTIADIIIEVGLGRA